MSNTLISGHPRGTIVESRFLYAEEFVTCARFFDPVNFESSTEGSGKDLNESRLEPSLGEESATAATTTTPQGHQQEKQGMGGLLLEQEIQYDVQDIDADFLASVYPKHTAITSTDSIDIQTSMIMEDAQQEQCMPEPDAFHDCNSDMDSLVADNHFDDLGDANFEIFAEAVQEEPPPTLDTNQYISNPESETIQSVDRARASEYFHQIVTTEPSHQPPWGHWIKKLEPDPMQMRWYGYITV